MSDATPRPGELTPDKQALLALRKMRAKIEEVERARTEPLAIVGIGCRFPGGASDPDRYWQLLHDGIDAVTDVPRERWDVERFYDADPGAEGKSYVRRGAFISDIDRFDAALFGISPREAVSLDPQQRLLLEVTWEALEHAGIAPASLSGSRTGVFVGIGGNDYAQRQVQAGAPLDIYFGTGNTLSAAAGRLSYVLGLTGPSMSIDTACSASLVAVHLACQSLRAGECAMAIAGGVSLMLAPEVYVTLCRARMLAPDGRCKTFDAAANGYVRGEGCGVVVLKRLSDALADGDRILATVRGSAVNQDGKSGGFTAPNELSQQQVIRDALASGGAMSPASIDYVEAHGTGTSLGDPIEVQALAAVLGEGRPADRPLVIGSVKTNFGHLEWAAGIAGLIKVVLALQHQEIPRHLHLQTLNPYVDWTSLPVRVADAARPWPAGERPRLAGVSSFGFTGTNAHIVLAEAPAAGAASPEADRPLHVLTLSARSDASLRALAVRAVDCLNGGGDPIADVCFTANAGRSHFQHRVAAIGASHADFAGALQAWIAGDAPAVVRSGLAASATREDVAFLFTGQGSQYVGMGRQLYDTQPAFRRALDRCGELFAPHLSAPLLPVIFGTADAGALDQTAMTQPALFALEYALAELWRSWGVEAAAVMGHSLGEYVAACVAGLFSLEDAAKLVAGRARLMQSLPAGGAMAAVAADADAVRSVIASSGLALSIAAVNAPDSTVISGAAAAVSAAIERLAAAGVETQRLTVSHAFHSALMDPILDAFEAIARTVSYQRPRIGIVSNLTGREIDPAEIGRPEYWRRHLRETVQCASGLRALHDLGVRTFLEIGPTPTLASLGRRTIADDRIAWLPSLRKGRGDWDTILEAVAALYARGVAIDWKGFDREYRRRRAEWPTYAFDRRRYWFEPGAAARVVEQPDALPRRDDWLHEETWEPAPLGDTAAAVPASWLIFADEEGVADGLATSLPATDVCMRVRRGRAFVRIDATQYESTDGAGDIDDVVRTFVSQTRGVRRIVYLWSLGTAPADGAVVDAAERDANRVLRLARALAGCAGNDAPRLWIATRGARVVAGSPTAIRVDQAPLWGLGRTLAAEQQASWGGLIDLDPSDDAATCAHALLAAVSAGDEDQISIRGGARLAARLAPKEMPAVASPTPWRRDAAYIVTGGFGGIGLEVARWMARQGARRLVLLGRHALPPRAEWAGLDPQSSDAARVAAALDLEALGATVEAAAVDVGDEAQVSAWLAAYRHERRPPIRGIVHAAGVTQYQAIADHRAGDLESVWRGKVAGAWLLNRALADTPLDFFVLFSSASALLSSPLVGSYAAANAFLDAVAEHRRASGLAALSVNWGAWARVGMAAGDESRSSTKNAIPPEVGVGMLAALIERDVPRAAVLPIDWREWQSSYPEFAKSPYLRRVIGASGAPGAARARNASMRAELLAASEPARAAMVADLLGDIVSAVLRIPRAELDPAEPLRHAGIDSLMALELRNTLQDRTGVSVPLVKLVEGPSVADLASLVLTALAEAPAEPTTAAAPSDADKDGALAGVADLSDDAVDAMLRRMLTEQ